MRRNRSRASSEAVGDTSTFTMDILGNSLGAVLFLLLLMMIIMVLLPRALASLHQVEVVAYTKDATTRVGGLPPATIGEPYQHVFTTQGGEEFVTLELVGGDALLPGLRWSTITHDEAGLSPQSPPYRNYVTKVGLTGTPSGPARTYTFTLQARSALPADKTRRERWLSNPDIKRKLNSHPRIFRLEYVHPTVKRLDTVADIQMVSPETLPPARIDADRGARVQLSAVGGLPPYQWSLVKTSGAAPDRWGISPAGEVTVTVAAPTEVRFEVLVRSGEAEILARKGKSVSATKTFTWLLLPPAEALVILTPADLPPAEAGQNYGVALAARGGTGTYHWAIVPDETEADWLSLDPRQSDRLKGSAPAKAFREKPYAVRVQVTDGAPGRKPVAALMRLRVDAPVLVRGDPADPAANVQITTRDNLLPATAGLPYGLMFAAQGGRAPYHWELVEWNHRDANSSSWERTAAALRLSEDGWLEGRAARSGEGRLLVRVWDSGRDGRRGARSDERTLNLMIKDPPGTVTIPLRIVTPPKLPDAKENVRYRLAFGAIGGLPPYQWSFEGQPPASFEFQNPAEGAFVGLPEAAVVGSHEFVVVLVDQRGPAAAKKLRTTLVVRPGPKPLRVVTTALPGAGLNQPYEAPLMAEGGQPPYRWSAVTGTLPEGLTLDETSGLVRGTPTRLSDQPSRLTVRVSPTEGGPAVGEISLAVMAVLERRPLRVLTSTALPPAVVGSRYEVQLAADGGVPPYQWEQGASWPDRTAGRLVLSTSGKLTNPVFPSARQYVLQTTVRDAAGQQAARDFGVRVLEEGEIPPLPPPLKIVTPPELPAAVVDSEYRLVMAAEGGWGYYSWRLEGQLPKGLKFENGEIRGKVEAVPDKPVSLALTVTDQQTPPATADGQFSLQVTKPRRRGGVVADAWKWFLKYGLGYMIVFLSYLIVAKVSSARTDAQILILRKRGLIIIQTSEGVMLDCTEEAKRKGICEELKRRYREVVEQYFNRRKAIRGFHVLAAIVNTVLVIKVY